MFSQAYTPIFLLIQKILNIFFFETTAFPVLQLHRIFIFRVNGTRLQACLSGTQLARHQAPTNSTGKWGKAQDWRLLADVGRQLQVPQCIVVTAMRPDMVLYSECERIVYFIELTIPFEDAIEEAFERKKLKYVELVAQERQRGWQAHTRPVEIGVRGFVAKSTTTLLLDFGF